MKTVYFQCALLYLLSVNTAYAMDVAPKKTDMSTQYVQVQVDVPLPPTAVTIKKNVNIQVPSELVATLQKQKSECHGEMLAQYTAQQTPGLQRMISVFIGLMQNKSSGQPIPIFGPMGNYDTTLFSLLKTAPTDFFYLCDERLILCWSLGEHKDGWRLNHSVEIQYVPNHPRKGTRSEAVIEFINKPKNAHFMVSLPTLQEQYEKAGKKLKITSKTIAELTKTKTEQELTMLHQADMIAVALHHIAANKK